MKTLYGKLSVLLIAVMLCGVNTGCVYHKTTLIRAKVDKGEGQIQGNPLNISGAGTTAVILRQVYLTDEVGRPVPPLQDIKETSVTDTTSNDFSIKNIKYTGTYSNSSEQWKNK